MEFVKFVTVVMIMLLAFTISNGEKTTKKHPQTVCPIADTAYSSQRDTFQITDSPVILKNEH
jgi:hypothetical protein